MREESSLNENLTACDDECEGRREKKRKEGSFSCKSLMIFSAAGFSEQGLVFCAAKTCTPVCDV